MLLSMLGAACVSPGPAEPENKSAPPAVAPEPPRAAFQVDGATRYNLIAVGAARKCVQPAGQSNATGMRLQITGCDGSKAQQYRLQSLPGNYVAIVNVMSDMCVDVAGASPDNGANIVQYPCRSGLNQQWVLADAPEGNLRLVARHSGRSLDVQGAATNDGTGLIQWPWSGDANQRFKLAAVKDVPDGGATAAKDAGAAPAVAAKGKEKGGAAAKKKKPAK
jgi:endo-1,4-beta-xylanase